MDCILLLIALLQNENFSCDFKLEGVTREIYIPKRVQEMHGWLMKLL